MLEVDIQVAEHLEYDVDISLIEQAIAAVLSNEGIDEPIEVSVLVTDDEELHNLNRDYRGIDAPTDVLSFADEEEAEGSEGIFVRPPDEPRYLGDLAISYERVLSQAEEYGHTPARELAYLAAHGTLHLLGYDHELGPEHEADMRQREEAAMEQLGLRRD
jgi:probable rRNA maturation factor